MPELAKFSVKVEFSIGLVSSKVTGYHTLDPQDTIAAVSAELEKVGVSGFSVVDVNGYWEGLRERSLLVSFFAGAERDWYRTAKTLAAQFAALFRQECVLVNITPANAFLVAAPSQE